MPQRTVTATATATSAASLRPLDLSFVDDRHGWFLGYRDFGSRVVQLDLQFTDDGGASWHTLPAPPAEPAFNPPQGGPREVRHVTFATRQDGWIYGGGLFVTHDGGHTWADEQPAGNVVQVAAADNTVWAVERQCRGIAPCAARLLTADIAGGPWQPLAQQPPVAALGGLLLRLGNGQAWLFGYGTAGQTRDGGASWRTVALPQPICGGALALEGFPLDDRLFATSTGTRLWLLCAGGASAGMQLRSLYTSDDDGQTWMEVPNQPRIGYAAAFLAVSAQRAFLGLWRGSLLRTDDGGRTWEIATSIGEGFYVAVVFVDSRRGWAAASELATSGQYETGVWRSSDGGLHWERVALR